MSSTVVTRFAPSPTGYLHIGGARTALFNWLYARAKGGKMLLRIEDTDRARSTEGAILAILDGLRWLELDWDGEPVYQLSRATRHREAAEQLLAEGKAYRCYATPRSWLPCARWRGPRPRAPAMTARGATATEGEAPIGITPVIRFRAPREGETIIEDQVQGRVVFANKDLDDLVILRSDGTPTYNLVRRRRRPRHGHHPCHPRRRSPHQCRAADADLQGARLGDADLRPCAADPRT